MIIIGGCNSKAKSQIAELDYKISGCDQKEITSTYSIPEVKKPTIVPQKDFIIINHQFRYVCCANITLNWSVSDNLIKIYEHNLGEMCFCLCDYNVNASIGPLNKGVYKIEVYGIYYEQIGKLLESHEVTIK